MQAGTCARKTTVELETRWRGRFTGLSLSPPNGLSPGRGLQRRLYSAVREFRCSGQPVGERGGKCREGRTSCRCDPEAKAARRALTEAPPYLLGSVRDAEMLDGRCREAYGPLCPAACPPSPGGFSRATSPLQPRPPGTSADSPKAQACHSQSLVLARQPASGVAGHTGARAAMTCKKRDQRPSWLKARVPQSAPSELETSICSGQFK